MNEVKIREDRDAALGHAKLLFNYIIENGLGWNCLCDDLADFIDEYESINKPLNIEGMK